jgi:nitrogen fixation/metabolism regulation signal transduction histidine kinase
MTEELAPPPRHEREPSSASLDISHLRESYVSLKERHSALKDDVSDMRSNIGDVKEILLAHMENASERHAQLLATFNQHRLENAVLSQKVIQIDAHLTATDTRMEESTKRDPVTFWTSITAAGTAVGAVLTAIFGGK